MGEGMTYTFQQQRLKIMGEVDHPGEEAGVLSVKQAPGSAPTPRLLLSFAELFSFPNHENVLPIRKHVNLNVRREREGGREGSLLFPAGTDKAGCFLLGSYRSPDFLL